MLASDTLSHWPRFLSICGSACTCISALGRVVVAKCLRPQTLKPRFGSVESGSKPLHCQVPFVLDEEQDESMVPSANSPP